MSIGWQQSSTGHTAFYVIEHIVGMVRYRNAAWWAYDLSGDNWNLIDQENSPLQIGGPYVTKDRAMHAVEEKFRTR